MLTHKDFYVLTTTENQKYQIQQWRNWEKEQQGRTQQYHVNTPKRTLKSNYESGKHIKKCVGVNDLYKLWTQNFSFLLSLLLNLLIFIVVVL